VVGGLLGRGVVSGRVVHFSPPKASYCSESVITVDLPVHQRLYRGLRARTHYLANLSKMSCWLHHVQHFKFYQRKIPCDKIRTLYPLFSVQKLSLLHYVGYRRFPLEQERIKWDDTAAAVIGGSTVISSRALSNLVRCCTGCFLDVYYVANMLFFFDVYYVTNMLFFRCLLCH